MKTPKNYFLLCMLMPAFSTALPIIAPIGTDYTIESRSSSKFPFLRKTIERLQKGLQGIKRTCFNSSNSEYFLPIIASGILLTFVVDRIGLIRHQLAHLKNDHLVVKILLCFETFFKGPDGWPEISEGYKGYKSPLMYAS